MKKEHEYPEKYQGFKLKWNDNKPHFKKGDKVIVKELLEYKEITLDKMTTEPMQTKWIRMGCRSCKKPGSVLNVDKFVYRWNEGKFTEHPASAIDPVKELNLLQNRVDYLEKSEDELSKKAALYDQIKMSINGELFQNDY